MIEKRFVWTVLIILWYLYSQMNDIKCVEQSKIAFECMIS